MVLSLEGTSEIGAREEQSLLLDMFKAFDPEQSQTGYFSSNKLFLFMLTQHVLSYPIKRWLARALLNLDF